MKKIFGVLFFAVITFSSQTAFAWDGHRGGGYNRGSHPVYSHNGGGHYRDYRGGHDNYRGGRHHGNHGGNNDLWLGLGAGIIAGAILSQPPPAYYSSPPVYRPQRCWTEWRSAHGLYDRYGNQLGQTFTFCQ